MLILLAVDVHFQYQAMHLFPAMIRVLHGFLLVSIGYSAGTGIAKCKAQKTKCGLFLS